MIWLRLGTVALAGVLVAGCGGGQVAGVPYGSPAPSGLRNDPAVTAAADRLDPLLRREFEASYAGLVLNHDDHTVVVYREPDEALDARVRREVTDVTVDLRDARMSRREMEDLTARVLADSEYWGRQGVTINSVGPRPDGSGIEVMASPGGSEIREKLQKRYGTDAITVTEGTVIAPTGEPWTPTPTAT